MIGPITHEMPHTATIAVIGSSTTFGAHDEEGLGWVARFGRLLAQSHPMQFLLANAGVSGHTMVDGYLNLCAAVALHKPSHVIIALGTNDILVTEGLEEETPQIATAKTLEAFLAMLDHCKAHGCKTLVIGPQGVEADVVRFQTYDDRLKTPSFRYENARLKALNDDLEALCAQENVPFLRLFEDWRDRGGLWADGLHPNAKGHQLWAEQTHAAFVKY